MTEVCLDQKAFLDESGIHNGAPVCVIAGYFGAVRHLRRLERGWKQALEDFHFPMEEFHATDSVDCHKHQPMLKALARAIARENKVYPVSWGIVVADFNSFSLEQRRFMTGASIHPKSKRVVPTGCPNKPYFVPFQNVVRLITDCAPVGGKAHFSFGLDKPFADYALKLFQQIQEQAKVGPRPWSVWQSMDRLGMPQFPKASETPQLQAADLLAHLNLPTYVRVAEERKS